MTYRHLAHLDDPAKPYKRVYACESHHPEPIYVKVHADRADARLGGLKWVITGSLCNSDGGALTAPDGRPHIHVERPHLAVRTEQGLRRPDAEALLRRLIADESEATLTQVRSEARRLFAEPPSAAEVEAGLAEAFERELLFVVAKVERGALLMRHAQRFGGVKPAAQ